MAPVQLSKKICLLGDLAVGKTSLVRRFVIDEFDDTYLTTIGVKITKKELSLELEGQEAPVNMKLMLWDIAGHHTFANVKAAYYRGSDGALVVCDLTRRETLDNIDWWCKALAAATGERPLVLLANKADLEGERQFDERQLKDFCEQLQIPFLLTSAKTGLNVELAFERLSELIARDHFERQG